MLQRAGRQVVQFRVRYPHETVQVGRQCPLYLAVSKDYQSVSKVYTLSHTFATCGRGQLTLLWYVWYCWENLLLTQKWCNL